MHDTPHASRRAIRHGAAIRQPNASRFANASATVSESGQALGADRIAGGQTARSATRAMPATAPPAIRPTHHASGRAAIEQAGPTWFHHDGGVAACISRSHPPASTIVATSITSPMPGRRLRTGSG
ncbi:MAG: hypothetical protein ACKPBU_05000 [Alphaproteobacteria bacterium]